MIKQEKGITLVSLIVTIILMLIIASVSVNTSVRRFEVNKAKKMYADIELLSDKISNYYLQYNGIPIIRDEQNVPILYSYTELDFNKASGDNSNYYIIDLGAMENILLNFGREGYENPNSSDDVYIINEASHVIYYVKGIKVDGKTYHYNLNLKAIGNSNDNIPPTKPEIKVVEGNVEKDGETQYYTGSVTLEFIPGKDNWSGVNKTTYSINGGQETDITNLDNNILKIENQGEFVISLKTYDNQGNTSEISSTFIVKKTLTKDNIGEYINYDCTKNSNGESLIGNNKLTYTVPASQTGLDSEQKFTITQNPKWRILGLEEGKILITTENTSTSLLTLGGKYGYSNSAKELNNICAIYGNGKYVLEARSVNVNDINKITKYDPTKDSKFSSTYGLYYKYEKSDGSIYSTNPSGNRQNTGKTEFNYYNWDEEKWKTMDAETVSLKSTYYYYSLEGYTDKTLDILKYNADGTNANYWLASNAIYPTDTVARYYVRYVKDKEVNRDRLSESAGYVYTIARGVRPIIALPDGIKLTWNDNAKVWEIK